MMSNPAIIISRPAAPPAPHLNLPLPLRQLIKRTSTWALSGEDYGYDPNGNLIYDRHRKITSINYNAIDRPAQIRFLQGDTISYIYTATGEKLAEISRSADGLSDLRRDYYGPFEFTGGSLDRTNYPQGYMDYYGYFYAYSPDYQGNILGIYNAATGRLDQFTDYYPYGQPHPDCTSPELNRRKFGAKELTTSFGLNEYDFAARRLSPLGAFTQPDPLAGKYPSISPYSYCAADPINLTDPTGMAVKFLGNPNDIDFAISALNDAFGYEAFYQEDGVMKVKDIPEGELEPTHLFMRIPLFSQIVNNPDKNIYLTLVNGSKGIVIADWQLATIDIADVKQLAKSGIIKAGHVFFHEIIEQFYYLFTKGTISYAHMQAILLECTLNNINYIYDKGEDYISHFLDSVNMMFYVNYTENGKIFQYRINLKDGSATKHEMPFGQPLNPD